MNKSKSVCQEFKLAYSTEEAAYQLSTNDHRINLLRTCGAIAGIKNGNKFIYSHKEFERFLDEYKGFNLQTETDIKLAVAQVKRFTNSTINK